MTGFFNAGVTAAMNTAGGLQGVGAVGPLTLSNGTSTVTLNTAQQAIWSRNEGTNKSMDMNDWSQVEFQNFVKWFIEVNHPEAVEQYQAIRDIERQAQEAEQIERDLAQAKMMEQYYKSQMNQARNMYQTGYTNTSSTFQPQNYGTVITVAEDETKPLSIWDKMKRMAGY